VKCRTLLKWFEEKYGKDQVMFANIDSAKKHPARVLGNMLRALRQCENIIFMPGQNIEIFAPVLRVLNKPFRRKIQYIVTGGDLAEVLKRRPGLKKSIAGFEGTHVQAMKLRDELREMGVKHAEYLPNCRDYVPAVEADHWAGQPLRVCTYSRVTESKGIADAAEICKKANALLGFQAFALEVYGKTAPEYEEAFRALCQREKETMRYCGVKNADEAVETLRSQFALLFPTYYEGECFAGTVLDAFASRTPIIANDWKYNAEVIRDGENGFLYPFRDTDAAAQKLAALYRDQALYKRIQEGCAQSAREYDSDRVLEVLAGKL
jgi:glycosyltransferase involved in cell wall biosynthesis